MMALLVEYGESLVAMPLASWWAAACRPHLGLTALGWVMTECVRELLLRILLEDD